MRRYIIFTILMLDLKIILNAQSDGFFTYHYECRENKNDEWGELIMIPPAHGLDYNYPLDNAPLGTGLILMAGMSMAYLSHRKKK